ncbi:MAG: prepilin-type N-terminal cleavage/methylation domain-containing protein [Oscillatoriaceae cyanobacterium Prado104]|jgi:type II secretory pathway pseudopilin PulG|nr:prepilin-type N-terminal cleavage/methylation domain-containing protein [Oscillatoriaceae cyanobacterium Prado104]
MKTPILLILHNYAATVNHSYKHKGSKKKDSGFTILELLVIVILLGTLAAIAAPGWLGFINRQRVRTVNDRVFQSLRAAQSEAKRTKSSVMIVFNAVDPPTVTIGSNTQPLNAEGEIKPGQVKLVAQANGDNGINSITFDYQGNIESPTIASRTPRQVTDGFTVTVSPTQGSAKQCVIVETLIGGMRTDEGTFNPSTGQGCP